jgi:membrane protein required for colicin V production
MNVFDIAVCCGLIIAAVTGFNTGLLRSALAILAYLLAMPIALWMMTVISPRLDAGPASPLLQSWPLFFGIFLASGMALGKLARMALDEAIGSEAGIADRLGGAAPGAIRVGLVATTFVLLFDKLLPANRQPAFLNGSQLRPLLSAAGAMGIRSLPAGVTATIDRLKKERQI